MPELPAVLKVANLQWNVKKRDFPGNLGAVDTLLESAVREKAGLVSLPEMWSQSFCGTDLFREAEHLDERLEALAVRARRFNLWVAGGTLPEKAGDGRVFNTFHLLDPKGKVRYRFRKMNLYPHARETELFAPPPPPGIPKVFHSGKWVVGAGVCFDIRFPELFQTQMKAGANLFFIPAQIPLERIEHFVLLTRARALENMSYVVATNRCGEGNKASFPGRSLVIGPLGMPLSELSAEEGCGIATIDASILQQTREKMPFLSVDLLPRKEVQ